MPWRLPLRPRSRRAGLLVAAVVAMLVAVAGPAAAAGQSGQPAADPAPSGLKMTVVPGFGGQAKFGCWIPVEVIVENAGPDVSGQVIINRVEPNSNYQTEYAVDAVVPGGAKKAFLLHIPFTDLQHGLTARFVNGQAELASARGQLEAIATTDTTVGVLSEDPSALNYLGAITLPGKRRVTVVHLSPAQLSEHAGVLDNFDYIVLDSLDTSGITKAQWSAMEAWADSGGNVVLVGGPNARKTLAGVPATLLPVQTDGVVTADLSPMATYAGKAIPGSSQAAVSKAKAKPEATVEIGRPDLPLLVQASLGSGHTLFFAADLTLAPLADWGGVTALWTQLLTVNSENSAAIDATQGMALAISSKMPVPVSIIGGSSLAYALRNLPVLDLPSMRLLGILLLVYVVIIGPLNYLILRRLDRRDLAWVTIPLVVALFAGSAYLFAFKGKGRDVITNTMAVVRLEPGATAARTQTYIGVFAPSRRSYTVSLAGSPLVSTLSAYEGAPATTSAGGVGPVTARITTGSSTTVEFLDMRMWSMQSFMADRAVASPGAVESDLHTVDDRLVGTATNKTPYVLKDAFVLADFGYLGLGDLQPGQTVQVDLRLTAVGGSSYGYAAKLNQIASQFNPKGSAQVDRENNRRRMLLESAFGWERSGSWDNDRVVVAGWVDQPIDQAVVAGAQGQSYYLALVGSPAKISFINGKDLTVPDGLLKPKLIEIQSNTAAQNPDGYSFSDGSLTFEAALPVVPEKLSSVIFWFPNVQNGPAGSVALKAEVYDWGNKSWVAVNLNVGTVDLGEATGYVSADGRIRVKLTNPGGVWFNVGEPMLSARGRVK